MNNDNVEISDALIEASENINHAINGVDAAIDVFTMVFASLDNNYEGNGNEYQTKYVQAYLAKLKSLERFYSVASSLMNHIHEEYSIIEKEASDIFSGTK